MCNRSSAVVCTSAAASSRIVLLNALLNQRQKEAERENLIGKMKECAICVRSTIADGMPPATFANQAMRLPHEVQQLLEGTLLLRV